MKRLTGLAANFALVLAVTAAEPRLVLVEAEQSAEPGGWVVDQQFMDVMGSPYLLAHGLGRPVAPARLRATFPEPGEYRVWVRTRDWAAPRGPGAFRLRVNGAPLAAVFGQDGDGAWHWQEGGRVRVEGGDAALELEDLTGFEGRCDAVLFASGVPDDYRPPNAGDELARWRRARLGLPERPEPAGAFDFVVAGGGYAGTCAALAAARLGLRVALIQDRPVLGGNGSGEVRVGPIGALEVPPFPRNGDLMKEIHAASTRGGGSGGLRPEPNDAAVLRLIAAETNLTLFLETRVTGAVKAGERLAAVVARHTRTSREVQIAGALFADCTGDGALGALAGADFALGREGRDRTGESLAPETGDRMVMGMSNFWTARRTNKPAAFPACPWALPITEESVDVSVPKYPVKFGRHPYAAGWNWESGFNRDPLLEAEQIRDHNFRAIYGTWDFLKNRGKERAKYASAELEWVAFIAGKRESRRLLGDLVLTEQDIRQPKLYPDGCVTATWYFDIHYPHPDNTKHFPGEEFRSLAYDDPNFERLRGDIPGRETRIKPYPIPFRCLYSRNVPNLFMAGRDISVTHVALAPVRVMNTTGQMGAVVGRAAFLCRSLGVAPRELYEKHLDAFKRLLADPGLGQKACAD